MKRNKIVKMGVRYSNEIYESDEKQHTFVWVWRNTHTRLYESDETHTHTFPGLSLCIYTVVGCNRCQFTSSWRPFLLNLQSILCMPAIRLSWETIHVLVKISAISLLLALWFLTRSLPLSLSLSLYFTLSLSLSFTHWLSPPLSFTLPHSDSHTVERLVLSDV